VRWPWTRKPQETFDSAPRPIADLFAELAKASGTTVTRSEALSVPAVRRGRNMLCAISTMPLEQIDGDNRVERSRFLEQIDPDVPNVVTIAQTIEDLVLSSVSWWEVTARDPYDYPIAARHLDVSTVSLDPPAGRTPAPLPSGHDPRGVVVWVDGKPVGASRIIRFDSPNPAFLQHAGRETRRAILLDQSASLYAEDPRPADYFTPADNADELEDAEVEQFLGRWRWARKRRATAYVPAAVKYNSVDSPSPQQLQLAELQKQASLDIANSLGIDPEDLGISTTSRTYANDVDRRRNRLNDVLAPYMRAMTDRLSMGDVTRRGHRVRFNTAEYLQPNPTDRWAVHKVAVDMKARTIDEVRVKEGEPPMPEQPDPPAPPAPLAPEAEAEAAPEPAPTEAATVTASHPAAMTFDSPVGLTFVDVPVETFSVDRENRIIEGFAMPYGQVGTKGGLRFMFEPGALQWEADSPGRVKLVFPGHGDAVGKAIQLRNTPAGVLTRFKVGRGAEGDRALESADDGVHDGLSVGIDFDAATDATPDRNDRNLLRVHRADLRHVALTAEPVFDNARVTRVAASRTTGGPDVADNENATPDGAAPEQTPAPAGAQLNQDQLTALLSRPGAIEALVQAQQPPAASAPETPAGGLHLSAEQVDGLIRSGQLGPLLGLPGLGAPAAPEPERATPVDPTRLGLSRVSEPEPYRFDRAGNLTSGSHEFSSDLFAFQKNGDQAAYERALSFVQAQFDVTGSNVAALNPNVNRPDLYVDQLEYVYPLWQAVSKGTLTDVTPFVVPKFSTSSGLVGDHTPGTEPTEGAFTATSQTITPTSVSGKVEIHREAWDQGGNPQMSNLIWQQMVREWFEDLESGTAAFLNTLTAAVDITITTGATDAVLQGVWDAAMADLNFARGGHRFSMFGTHIDLYKAFVAAKDTAGRKLYPQINPQNANGSAEPRFGKLDLGGVTGVPSWALGATGAVAANSWLFNPEDVSGWASAPQRFDFNYRVSLVDVSIWGYKAFANTRIDGVRQVIYDPVV